MIAFKFIVRQFFVYINICSLHAILCWSRVYNESCTQLRFVRDQMYRSVAITKKSKLLFMLWNRPPTMAAKWITWVGLYFSNRLFVACKSLKMFFLKIITLSNRRVGIIGRGILHLRSASVELVNIHRSSGSFWVSTIVLMALPTRPVPPVTRITLVILRSFGGTRRSDSAVLSRTETTKTRETTDVRNTHTGRSSHKRLRNVDVR